MAHRIAGPNLSRRSQGSGGKPYLVIERDRAHDCCGTEIWHGPWQWFLIAPKHNPMVQVLGTVESLTVEAALSKAKESLNAAPSRQWISRRANRILESAGNPAIIAIAVGGNWNVYDLRTGSAQMIGIALPDWEQAKMLAEARLAEGTLGL